MMLPTYAWCSPYVFLVHSTCTCEKLLEVPHQSVQGQGMSLGLELGQQEHEALQIHAHSLRIVWNMKGKEGIAGRAGKKR